MEKLPSHIQTAVRIILHYNNSQASTSNFAKADGFSEFSIEEVYEAAKVIEQLRGSSPDVYNAAISVLEQKIKK